MATALAQLLKTVDTVLEDLQERIAKTNQEFVASCPVLSRVEEQSELVFQCVLLQRRFVSLAFTPFYDTVIDTLTSPDSRKVCRQILREEYPDEGGDNPSHREDLMHDLVALGITRDRILGSRPTLTTMNSISGSFNLIRKANTERHSEVAVLAAACCYGEALVGAEYQALMPRIEQMVPSGETRFFGPHIAHDNGHATILVRLIAQMVEADPGRLFAFEAAQAMSVEVKVGFYAQFE